MTLQQDHTSMPTDTNGKVTRPLTGDQYIESLRDGREVYLYGEKVDDVTTHPAFRNAVRMTARLYDSLHDPDKQDVLTVPTDTGSTGVTHPFFRTPHSVEDLKKDRDAIAEWARMTYGFMGRSPDYKAAFLGTLGANSEFYDPYAANARRWYQESQGRSSTGTTRSSTHRWTATVTPTRSPTCSCTSRRRTTTASSCPGRRSSPPGRRSPTTTSWPTTGCRSRSASTRWSAPCRWAHRA